MKIQMLNKNESLMGRRKLNYKIQFAIFIIDIRRSVKCILDLLTKADKYSNY